MEHSDKYGVVLSETRGYTVDDLDTRVIEEATNDFERIFIHVRQVFEDNNASPQCDYLDLCHKIARRLTKKTEQI